MSSPRFALVVVAACAGAAAAGGAGCGDDDGGAAIDAGTATDGAIPPPIGPFPTGFLWGTAIAPYQAEGGLADTDWAQWESLCGNCSGDHADDGPDFWNHYETDFANAEMISNNTIRLGIDWSRVFPTAESFATLSPEPAVVQHYHDILAAARAHGLNPMVTLHHFVTPVWLHDLNDLASKKGWADPALVAEFAAFAGWAGAEFGAEVDWWITLNEPMVYVAAGYFGGTFPPGKTLAIAEGIAATFNMIDGHVAAYDAIQQNDVVDADGDGAPSLVSIAQHSRVFLPDDPRSPESVRATAVMKYIFNSVFLDGIVNGTRDLNLDLDTDDPGEGPEAQRAGRADFIGLDYDGVSLVIPMSDETNYPVIGVARMNDLDLIGLPGPITDFGWTIHPEGLRQVLDETATYGLPIVITANGLADLDDNQRPRFLLEHLYAIGRAIDDGVDIRGYYHRALMDNFEWAAGYCPAFGLFHVDFASAQRTRTAGEGAEVYRRIIDANTVPVELFGTYPGYPSADHYCTRTGF